MKTLKLTGFITAIAFITLTLYGQELGYKWDAKAYHITTLTSYNIVGNSRLTQLTLGVSGVGTSWQIQVKTLEDTPKILATWVTADGLGTFRKLALDSGVIMTGGITIVSSGTTAGTADLFLTRRGAVDATPTPTATPTPSSTATSTPTPTP